MKKIITFILVICLSIGMNATCMAAADMSDDTQNDVVTYSINSTDSLHPVYQLEIHGIMNGNYTGSFTLPVKGLIPTNQTVYLSGGAGFVDGVQRNITVTIGSANFGILADGSTSLRGSVNITQGIPVIVTVTGITSPCILVFDIYTIED